MLKFFFWTLLLANLALFAYSQGYLGAFKSNEHEPARMKLQLNPEKLVLMSSAQATAAASAATAAAKPAPEAIACMEAGDFNAPEAKKFETQLAALNLGERQSRFNLGASESSTHIVYIPPQGSKEAAEKKAAELRQLGVSNYFVMNDGPMKWGISLGVFKKESAAQGLLASLNKQGVHSAKLAGRGGNSGKLAYRFKDIDSDIKAKLDAILQAFDNQALRSCAK